MSCLRAPLLATENKATQGQIIKLPLPTGDRWFELSTALKPDSQNPKHFIMLSRDITERRQTEEKLRRSQKIDALGKLTGGIAHDFNNMLGVILGYTELLEEQLEDNPKLSRYARQINTAGNRAKLLTSKLLSFSRQQPTNKKISNINNILKNNQHMLEKTLTAIINLKIESSNELWNANIDEEMLADAILNMCINAMHAMPNGGALTIRTNNIQLNKNKLQHFSIPAGDYVQLSIMIPALAYLPTLKIKYLNPSSAQKEKPELD